MEDSCKDSTRNWKSEDDIARAELDRINARLRHFRGVAAQVMDEALGVWKEIWDACQDPRSWEEILDGVPEPAARTPAGGWAEFHEKLHLLGAYLDYAKRLCEGSLIKFSQTEREVETCPKNSESLPRRTSLRPEKFFPPKKE